MNMRYNTKLNVKRKEIETMKLGIVEDEPIFVALYNSVKHHKPSKVKAFRTSSKTQLYATSCISSPKW